MAWAVGHNMMFALKTYRICNVEKKKYKNTLRLIRFIRSQPGSWLPIVY